MSDLTYFAVAEHGTPVTSLTNLASDDVVQELLTRIEQLEAQNDAGYGPCLNFYKRIAARIEHVDSLYFAIADAELKKRGL